MQGLSEVNDPMGRTRSVHPFPRVAREQGRVQSLGKSALDLFQASQAKDEGDDDGFGPPSRMSLVEAVPLNIMRLHLPGLEVRQLVFQGIQLLPGEARVFFSEERVLGGREIAADVDPERAPQPVLKDRFLPALRVARLDHNRLPVGKEGPDVLPAVRGHVPPVEPEVREHHVPDVVKRAGQIGMLEAQPGDQPVVAGQDAQDVLGFEHESIPRESPGTPELRDLGDRAPGDHPSSGELVLRVEPFRLEGGEIGPVDGELGPSRFDRPRRDGKDRPFVGARERQNVFSAVRRLQGRWERRPGLDGRRIDRINAAFEGESFRRSRALASGGRPF